MEEEWRDVPGLSPYQVSSLGNVRRVWSNGPKMIVPAVSSGGYKCVKLSVGNQAKSCWVHRLVASAFLENPEGKPTVDHINRNPSDNSVSNLRWATHSEQLRNRKCYSALGHRHIYHRSKNRYAVAITRNKTMAFQKLYPTLEEAIVARDAWLAAEAGGAAVESGDWLGSGVPETPESGSGPEQS